jgi:hypothetical protein
MGLLRESSPLLQGRDLKLTRDTAHFSHRSFLLRSKRTIDERWASPTWRISHVLAPLHPDSSSQSPLIQHTLTWRSAWSNGSSAR